MTNFYVQVEPFLNDDFVSSCGGSFAYKETYKSYALRFNGSNEFERTQSEEKIRDGYFISENLHARTVHKYKIVKQFNSYEEMMDEVNRHLLLEELIS